jgi:hypothetical protein
MASFYLKAMVRFDQNNLFWYKMTSFWPIKKQKQGMSNDLSADHYSSSSTFCAQKTTWMTTF